MKVVLVGYTSTDKYINDILDGVEYESKIGMSSPRGKILRYLARQSLKKQDKKISSYKRIYCLVGDDIYQQFHDSEVRFMKTLSGKPLSDAIGEFDIEVLDVIDEELKKKQTEMLQGGKLNYIYELQDNFNKSFKRDLDTYLNFKRDYWYTFRTAEMLAEDIHKAVSKFKEEVVYSDPLDDVKDIVAKIAKDKKWL